MSAPARPILRPGLDAQANRAAAEARMRRDARFRRVAREEERSLFAAHAWLADCADSVEGVAETDGETWLMAERDWFGFPDPPRWAFVALSAGGLVVAAADFDEWPAGWTLAAPADGEQEGT